MLGLSGGKGKRETRRWTQRRERWMFGHGIEWRLTDFSRNQPPINYKRLIDLKITLGKFTYPNSLRTAEVLFPAVPFLPPKNNVLFFRGREATTGNTSAVCRLLSQGLHWAFLSLYHLFSRMARLNEYLYAGLSFSFLSLHTLKSLISSPLRKTW